MGIANLIWFLGRNNRYVGVGDELLWRFSDAQSRWVIKVQSVMGLELCVEVVGV